MKCLQSALLFFVVLFGFIATGQAHALYIDTPSEGTVGETHEIKVYYSEFADRTKEKVSDWFSDAAQFKLWLIHPDGSRTQLETTANEDHLRAGFIPKENGIYRLEISHTTAEVPEKTAFQFNAFAQVKVGSKKKAAKMTTHHSADFALLKVNKDKAGKNTAKYRVFLNGTPKADVDVTLFHPSGKTTKLKSDKNGFVRFTSGENGIHFLEAAIFQKAMAGKTKQSAYESLWRCATQKVDL